MPDTTTLHIRIPSVMASEAADAARDVGIPLSRWVLWSIRDQLSNPGSRDYLTGSDAITTWIREHGGYDTLAAADAKRSA